MLFMSRARPLNEQYRYITTWSELLRAGPRARLCRATLWPSASGPACTMPGASKLLSVSVLLLFVSRSTAKDLTTFGVQTGLLANPSLCGCSGSNAGAHTALFRCNMCTCAKVVCTTPWTPPRQHRHGPRVLDLWLYCCARGHPPRACYSRRAPRGDVCGRRGRERFIRD